MNILLTSAGRRSYLVSFFKEAINSSDRIYGADMSEFAPALVICHGAFKVPAVSEPSFIEDLKRIIIDAKIDLVFSLNDLELGSLALHRRSIESETGATVYVPPVDTNNICSDKLKTADFAESIGVAQPKTFLSPFCAEKALSSRALSFPLIVKPRWGSASTGLFIVNSSNELTLAYEACRGIIEKSHLAHLGIHDAVIIQEFIKGTEYGLDILYGKDEKFIGFTAKKKLIMRAGETDKAVTVNPKPFQKIVSKIALNLPHRGNLDCDFIERDNVYYLIELNPRFGGGYPFTHLAGANHVQMLINDYLGLPASKYSYSVNKCFAKYDSIVEVSSGIN